MNVERGRVVRFHYELSDGEGNSIATTRDRGPRALLFGMERGMSGLDRALAGRAPGDRFEVVLPPEEAFGMRLEASRRRISKKRVIGPKRLAPGMGVHIPTERGPRPVTVLKVGSSVVDVDINHPLAGITVHADVEIVDVREADAEELAHGHAHDHDHHHDHAERSEP